MIQFLKDKTIGFYISLAASVIALITNIIFIAVDVGDRTFSVLTFICILLGVAAQVLACFKNYKFLPLLPALFFGVALGNHLFIGLPTLSDVWNGVNFVGGNPDMVISFGIVFFICTALAVAACFMNQRKPETQA